LKRQVVRPWLKRQVVRPMSNSLQGERVCWGSDFSWRESNTSYEALRIPDLSVVEALEGKWSS
jgi:hypothetical protein